MIRKRIFELCSESFYSFCDFLRKHFWLSDSFSFYLKKVDRYMKIRGGLERNHLSSTSGFFIETVRLL